MPEMGAGKYALTWGCTAILDRFLFKGFKMGEVFMESVCDGIGILGP